MKKDTRNQLLFVGAFVALVLFLGSIGSRSIENAPSSANIGVSERFYAEARHNKAYSPTIEEINEWIELIERESDFDDAVPFYLALILAESSGNPTVKTDSGLTRGLMCVSIDAARDVVKRRGFKVDKISIALYNPRWNIICGIDHYETIYKKWQTRKWSMTIYNAGERKVTKWVSDGKRIKHSHWKRVQEKLQYLEGGEK